MVNLPTSNSRSRASVFLLVAYLIFVILTAIVNYILPFLTYLVIFLGVAGIILLLNLLPESKEISIGKGKAKIAIYIIVIIVFIFAAWWPMMRPMVSMTGIIDLSKKTYGPNELQAEAICSETGCSKDSTGIILSDGGSFTINGSENLAINMAIVTPMSLPVGTQILTSIGPYDFLTKVEPEWYRGDISLNDISIANQLCTKVEDCLPRLVKTDNDVSITVRTIYWSVLPFAWLVRHASLSLKEAWYEEVFASTDLVGSYDKTAPIEGKFSVSSVPGRGSFIVTEVRIY